MRGRANFTGFSLLLAGCAALLSPPLLAAPQDGSSQRVAFARGTSSATANGTIRGYQYIDYILNVRAGQRMTITLNTRHTATYFNLIEPGQKDVAIHIGDVSGNRYEGRARLSGDYRIRVYMMRSAARRGEVARFQLTMAVNAGATVRPPAIRPPGDALVPGTGYHATGTIDCRIGTNPARRCGFGVRRRGRGDGDVTVTRPNGAKRVIIFTRGRATGYTRSSADNPPFSVSRRDDFSIVRIGQESYILPDAIIWGG